ncbi:MAG: Uma2 family endonuclease [Blastocatellia bacterium]|nr:Uma2 family endonuclease [Blastocatellia bacterium]
MTTKKVEPVLTIEDLGAMPEDWNRYELIEGELLVSRAPTLTHQRIVRRLLVAIENYLDRNPIGEVLPGPEIIFSAFSSVIPDVVYLSNDLREEIAWGEQITGAPELIIEVLSPGAKNERRDRQAKRQLYGDYSVEEYWIADSETSTLEIYRSPGLKLTATLSIEDEITSPLLPGFRLRVRDVFGS